MLTPPGIYPRLLAAYGPQGWWPLLAHRGGNPTKTGGLTGYHPGQYRFPATDSERFEICIGAILTQNTAWTNVEKALANLAACGGLDPAGLEAIDDARLRDAIRPSGYYNAKARKLREFAAFHRELAGCVPQRPGLLGVWGIGPETADSIRLYAYGCLEMVVDAYTRRILGHLGLVSAQASYDEVRDVCMAMVPASVVAYQEFHALMVEHAKRHYRRTPYADPLLGD